MLARMPLSVKMLESIHRPILVIMPALVMIQLFIQGLKFLKTAKLERAVSFMEIQFWDLTDLDL